MRLQLITNPEELASLRSEWDSIASASPFFSHAWLTNWFRFLGDENELAVLVGRDKNNNVMGIAPWCIEQAGPLVRKLRFLGSGIACSDYLELICPANQHRSFAEAAIDWLVDNIGNRQTLGRIDVIEMEGINPDSAESQYVAELLGAHGLKSHRVELEGGWEVTLPATWDELNSRFSKSMRRKTKKAVKRLADEKTQVLSTDRVPFDQLWSTFCDLHQQRRKMLGQDGCFADPKFEEFLKSATFELIHRSQAELVVIHFENKPLASMLLLNNQDTVYMYQSGMDAQRLSLEAGYQMAYCAIVRSIEKGFQKFDFLRGDEPYKSRWDTRRIPIQRVRFIPRRTSASLKHGLWVTGRSIKGLVAPLISSGG